MTRKKVITSWMLSAHHEVKTAKRDAKNLEEFIYSLDAQGGELRQIDKDQLLNLIHEVQDNLNMADDSMDYARMDLARYGTKKGGA